MVSSRDEPNMYYYKFVPLPVHHHNKDIAVINLLRNIDRESPI